MIRYFDTSALVKLLVVEPDSGIVRRLFRDSTARLAHDIAYVEMHSAVSRLARTEAIELDVASGIRGKIDPLWVRFDRLRIDAKLLREAAALTAIHPLAAYDSLHLASVLRVRENVGDAEVGLVCFDATLRAAATAEEMVIYPED